MVLGFSFDPTVVVMTSSKNGHLCEISLRIEFQSKPAMSGYWFFLRTDGVFFLHSSVHFSFSSCKIFALKIVFNDGTLYITSTTTEGTPVLTALVSFRTMSVSRTRAADLVIQQVDEEFLLKLKILQHQFSPNNLTYFLKKIQVTRFNYILSSNSLRKYKIMKISLENLHVYIGA